MDSRARCPARARGRYRAEPTFVSVPREEVSLAHA